MKGTVEQVVGSHDLRHAEKLVVRTGFRRRNIPVDAVDVVVPAARLIVVYYGSELEPTPAERHTRAVAEASARAASSVADQVAHTAPQVARSSMSLARAFAILVAAGLLTLGQLLRFVALNAAQLARAVAARLRSELEARRAAATEQRRRTRTSGSESGVPRRPVRSLNRPPRSSQRVRPSGRERRPDYALWPGEKKQQLYRDPPTR